MPGAHEILDQRLGRLYVHAPGLDAERLGQDRQLNLDQGVAGRDRGRDRDRADTMQLLAVDQDAAPHSDRAWKDDLDIVARRAHSRGTSVHRGVELARTDTVITGHPSARP